MILIKKLKIHHWLVKMSPTIVDLRLLLKSQCEQFPSLLTRMTKLKNTVTVKSYCQCKAKIYCDDFKISLATHNFTQKKNRTEQITLYCEFKNQRLSHLRRYIAVKTHKQENREAFFLLNQHLKCSVHGCKCLFMTDCMKQCLLTLLFLQ